MGAYAARNLYLGMYVLPVRFYSADEAFQFVQVEAVRNLVAGDFGQIDHLDHALGELHTEMYRR